MIKRKLLPELLSHLEGDEIILVVGSRQAGKTTIMDQVMKILKEKGEKVCSFNLDFEQDKEHFASQNALISRIRLTMGEDRGYVFIDEIQRKEDAGVFLKGIYDMKLPYKFIATGSGSIELKEKMHESLAGRKRLFHLNTLSFEEFVDHKTVYKYENKQDKFLRLDNIMAAELLKEYLTVGGYPRVVLEETISEKKRIMEEIFSSFIERDIAYLLGVRNTASLVSLVKMLAIQTGATLNYSKLSTDIPLSFVTLKNYLWYLEKMFIVSRVSPFFRNAKKEMVKAPVYYFDDLGMRNLAAGTYGSLNSPGMLFQNFVFRILKEALGTGISRIHFWRTKDGAEVDFVIDSGPTILPVEAKYSQLKKTEVTRSARSFIEQYKPQRFIIVNLSREEEGKIKGTRVHFLPFYKLKGFVTANI